LEPWRSDARGYKVGDRRVEGGESRLRAAIPELLRRVIGAQELVMPESRLFHLRVIGSETLFQALAFGLFGAVSVQKERISIH
jgi:hypothetical protein